MIILHCMCFLMNWHFAVVSVFSAWITVLYPLFQQKYSVPVPPFLYVIYGYKDLTETYLVVIGTEKFMGLWILIYLASQRSV
uniref:Putative product n=1 Tax=Xenopsylla cheopis TaxID=163159 RepID=A0A6M2DY14_XENCH